MTQQTTDQPAKTPSAKRGKPAATRADARGEQLGLSLAVTCAEWTLAIDATPIERILMLDEVRTATPILVPEGTIALGVVHVGGRGYAAFDLAALLGKHTAPSAWVLLSVRHQGRRVPIALRTGAVRRVDQHGDLTMLPLPAGLTPARPGVFGRGFVRRDAQGPSVGLELCLDRLFSVAELDAAVTALAARQTAAASPDLPATH
jgi:hypothetical protein